MSCKNACTIITILIIADNPFTHTCIHCTCNYKCIIIHVHVVIHVVIHVVVHVINPHLRVGRVEGYCNRFVCGQNSSKPTDIGNLKILLEGIKSYKVQR